MNLGLIPLKNFAHIGDNLYRSAQPEYSEEYEWLKKVLDLKWIVNLRAESMHDHIFSPGYGIQVIDFPVKDRHTPTREQADEFIKFVQKTEGNILIHCEHGHGRTSTFSVLAQIAKGMALTEALEEERRRFHYAFRHSEQKDFLLTNYLNSLAAAGE